MTYFGCVVNHIVATTRNAGYAIRRELTDRRHLLEMLLKVAGARMAVQALQVAVSAD